MNKPSRRWQAIGGYIIDIYRFAQARLENPHSYLKFLRLKRIQEDTGARVLIETGTYLGVTSYRCSFIYEKVFTIELSNELALAARKFLARRSHVHVICGDGVVELPSVFKENSFDRAVVFLDGHYSGGITAAGAVLEPVVEELHALKPFVDRIEAIVIDDFRTFAISSPPSKSKVLSTCEQLFDGFELSVKMDQITLVRSA